MSGLRRVLLAVSAGAGLAGALLILGLPLRPGLKFGLICLWLLRSVFELRSQIRGAARLDRIRICAEGSLEGLAPDGAAESLSLVSGSVVLSRIAWLRLRFDDGLGYGELLVGNPRRDEQWRRLQVIWRQHAAAFGGLRGS